MSSQTFTATLGGESIAVESGRLAGQAGGAVAIRCGDTVLLVTGTAGDRLLPPYRRFRGAALRRGPHPGFLLPSRGPADRISHSHGPAGRPSAKAALPR